jgi:hypothetical protein
MADTQDEPMFVVKLTGILSPEDIERYARKFEEQLPGRVIVTDNRVEDIREVTGMRPRDAIVTVHHKRKEFESMGVDGNTPNWRYFEEIELVNARVWPVSMGPDEMLVEYEDGRLGAVKLKDIRLGNHS